MEPMATQAEMVLQEPRESPVMLVTKETRVLLVLTKQMVHLVRRANQVCVDPPAHKDQLVRPDPKVIEAHEERRVTVAQRAIQASLDKMVKMVKPVILVMMVAEDLVDQPGQLDPKEKRVHLVSMALTASLDQEVRIILVFIASGAYSSEQVRLM